MKRSSLENLKSWFAQKRSKPLVIRGARQVGKSTLVRLFCEDQKLDLIECNLEIESFRSVHSPDFRLQELLDEIQLKKRKKIHSQTVLFFDEIQENPTLLMLLRYFYEDAPHLKVIAAGSLLEIALKSKNFSFPVGRIQFLYLGPMSFREFLWATDRDFLDQKLLSLDFSHIVHQAGLEALREYLYVGGMPEVVTEFARSKSLVHTREIQSQIIQTYQADFPKYNRRVHVERISRVFSSLAMNIGKKLIYSKLDPESTSRDIKKSVELLTEARVILPCFHSAANSSPLMGEMDERILKVFALDAGLLGAMLNLSLETIDLEFKNEFNLKGQLVEQYVAQHLCFLKGASTPPNLFYHLRDKGSGKAEVDFIIENEMGVYPVEVKSSAIGHLKSLKMFCQTKKSFMAFKISLAPYSEVSSFAKETQLINLPLYAVEYLQKVFEEKEVFLSKKVKS